MMASEVIGGADETRIRVGDRVLVDPVLYCGTCFDCRAGRTNLCPNGGVVGREVNEIEEVHRALREGTLIGRGAVDWNFIEPVSQPPGGS